MNKMSLGGSRGRCGWLTGYGLSYCEGKFEGGVERLLGFRLFLGDEFQIWFRNGCNF